MDSTGDLFGALKFRELNLTGLQPGNGAEKSEETSGRDLRARLEKALKEAKTLDSDDDDLPALLLEIGSLHYRLGAAPQARLWLERSLAAARSLENTIIIGRALVSLGMMEARDGDLGLALNHFNDVLENDVEPRMLGIAWMEIGVIHAGAGELEPAEVCFNRSLEYFERSLDQINALCAMVNIASIRRSAGEYPQALEIMLEVMMGFEEHDQQGHLFDSLVSIADIYLHMQELETALVYGTRAWSTAQKLEDRCHDARALLCIGDIYRLMGNAHKAVLALEYAVDIAAENNDCQLEYQLHEVIALTHEATGDLGASLAHLKRMIELREEHIRKTGRRSLAAMRARVENELKQGEEFKREAHQLRGEVAEKKRELTSLALSLVQKSEILNEMKSQLRELLSSAHNHSEAMVTPVLRSLVESKGPEESWQVFEQQFNTVHRDFMKNLAERYPTLTPMELKLCALTRIDLSTKDIAHLLFVSVRNVQNHRYRLRKKLGLSSEANLTLFLTAI